MMLLVLTTSACSTTHYAALTDETYNKLALCQRPSLSQQGWLACGGALE